VSKELLLVMEAVANEKGVDRQVIVQAMEQALASAAKKRYHDEDVAIRVAIIRKTALTKASAAGKWSPMMW